jgi:tetratricopeptide (TPR) repeat protein
LIVKKYIGQSILKMLRRCFFILLTLAFLCTNSSNSIAKNNADSLYKCYNSKTLHDTLRLKAFGDFIWNFYLFNNPDTARIMAKEQLSFAKKSKQLKYEAEANNIIGVSYFLQDNYKEAQKYYLLNLQIRQQLNDEKGIATAYNNLATLNLNKSKFLESINYYQKSLSIRLSIKDSIGIASCYNNLGTIFHKLKDYDNAEKYYLKALLFFKKNSVEVADVYNNLGGVYTDKDEYKKAKNYYTSAFAISKRNNLLPNQAKCFNNLGHLYIYEKQMDSAFYCLKKAIALKIAIDNYGELAISYHYLAIYFKGINELDSAIFYNSKAINLATEYENKTVLSDCYYLYYEVYKNEFQYKNALHYFELHKALLDSLNNDDSYIELLNSDLKIKSQLAELKKEKENIILTQKIKNRNYLIFGICLFALIALIALWFYFKYRNSKNKSKIQQLEQGLLRLHMNPHFIFNSLNSIQGFYADNNATEAKIYINKFSNLLRMILENSNKSYISLQSEINLISNYLELSMLRSDNNFTYSIFEETTIRKENTLIPPMIIQPFVENAFLHGIKPLITGGKIDINISIAESNLKIEISDNGNGIISKNEKQLTNKNESTGVAVSKKRIAYANNTANENQHFSIQNNIDLNGKVLGCIVVFYLPLLTND